MPIDLTLLRPPEEGGNPDLVISWQNFRAALSDEGTGGDGDIMSAATAEATTKQLMVVHELQHCDVRRRDALRDLNTARKQLNECKRSLRPSEAALSQGAEASDGDEIKQEAQDLSTRIIPDMLQSVTSLETKIEEELLPQLANMVDDTTFTITTRHMCKSKTNADKGDDAILDPLLCLGGYERVALPVPSDKCKTSSDSATILTGVGVPLASAIAQYASWFLSLREATHLDTRSTYKKHPYRILTCPYPIEIGKATAHSVMGCSKPVCSICSEESGTVRAPFLLTATALHSGKRYSDGELPIFHLCKSNVEGSTDTDMKGPIQAFSHQMEHLSIFALSLPTLASSQLIQNELSISIVDMYESMLMSSDTPLLSLPNRRCSSVSATCPLVRAHTIDIPSLEMNECRRIVVEGYLPSAKSYVQLGYVSNTVDYVSRAFGIRCCGAKVGGGKPQGGSPEHPHIVHAVVCDVRTTLSWISENNAGLLQRNEEDETVTGLALPTSISDFLQVDENEIDTIEDSVAGMKFLPFCRRVMMGKKGKTFIVENIQKKAERTNPKAASMTFATHREPTQLELEAEALSVPFGFLPIGVRY